jgi:hypothetical protein
VQLIMAVYTGTDETTNNLSRRLALELMKFLTGLDAPTAVVMQCSHLNSTDVSEEHMASILRIEK